MHHFLPLADGTFSNNHVPERVEEPIHTRVGWDVRIHEHAVTSASGPLVVLLVALSITVPREYVRATIPIQTVDWAMQTPLDDLTRSDVLESEHTVSRPRWVVQHHSLAAIDDR